MLDATGWPRDYSPSAWRNRATAEQKREGWEMAVRVEKIIAMVLSENYGFGMILEEALYYVGSAINNRAAGRSN